MSRSILAVAVASGLCAALLPARARAGGRNGNAFVDVPLTLPPLHFSADAGLGFGTYRNGQNGAAGTQTGSGSNLEASLGVPFLGEIGIRTGYRFGPDGIAAGSGLGADHFARLFDPIVNEPGGAGFADPEIHLRGTLVPLEAFELGLETRFVVPTAPGSVFAMTPGVPIRIHVPGSVRIDTGLWLPFELTSVDNTTPLVLDIPAQLFVQVGDGFVGPLTGVRFVQPGGGPGSSVDVPLGVGGGYTIGGILDIKAQLRTERINSSGWASQAFGGGLGVGIRVP